MRARPGDAEELVDLVRIMWSEDDPEKLVRTIDGYLGSEDSAVFVERAGGQAVGVAFCGLRHDYVEGCETSPVGYLEGVSVKDGYRLQGLARRLVSECEQWAREKGCSEFASDCELDNPESLSFHTALGFREANRIVCFTKEL